MIWNDGATDAQTVTGLSTEEMGVHKACQLKENVHKGGNFSCNETASSKKLKKEPADHSRCERSGQRWIISRLLK